MRILLLSLLILSCNPVKQVLKDKARFEELAKEVVRSGYCANDTIIQTKSDTLVTYDTVYEKGAEIINDIYRTDTLRIPVTKKITKTITIRDTVQKIVVDNSRIKQFEADFLLLSKKAREYQDKAQTRLLWLILLLIAILVRILYKPIKKLILWHS